MRFLIDFILFIVGYGVMNWLNQYIDSLLKLDKKTNSFLYNISSGYLTILCFHKYDFSLTSIIILLIIFLLLVIAKIDYLTMNIYLSTIIILSLLVMCYCLLQKMSLIEMIMGAISVASIMLFFDIIIPSSFGFGDVELMFIAGMMLGFQKNILAMIIAIWTGGIYALYVYLFQHCQKRTHIAFAPYLVIGILISLFYGQDIIYWYWTFLLL